MSGHDGSTEHGISSGFRFYPGNSTDWYCIGRSGACVRLGYLGHAGHLRAWQNGQVVLFDVVWATLRASIVLMVLGFYLR